MKSDKLLSEKVQCAEMNTNAREASNENVYVHSACNKYPIFVSDSMMMNVLYLGNVRTILLSRFFCVDLK